LQHNQDPPAGEREFVGFYLTPGLKAELVRQAKLAERTTSAHMRVILRTHFGDARGLARDVTNENGTP
jgi:nucleoid-associated protein YgaU